MVLQNAREHARAEGLLQSFREFKPKFVKRRDWDVLKDDAMALEELLMRLMKRRAEEIQERFLNSGLAFAAQDDLEVEISALELSDAELDEMLNNIAADATLAVASVQDVNPADMPVSEVTRATVDTVRDVVVSLDNRQKEDAISQIRSGINEGLGREQIAERIAQRTQASLWRSRMIAQTEVIRAYNTATMATFEQLGVEYVEWGDGQAGACPSCASLHGAVVKRGNNFSDSVRGFTREIPPLHPNCRCTLLRTEVEEEPTVESDYLRDEDRRAVDDYASQVRAQDFEEGPFVQSIAEGWTGNSSHVEAVGAAATLQARIYGRDFSEMLERERSLRSGDISGRDVQDILDGVDDDFRKDVDAIYSRTQKDLASLFPSGTVKLYRGLRGGSVEEAKEMVANGQSYRWESTGLQSFSSSRDVASSFAGTNGIVLELDVPVSHIFGYHKNGFGYQRESEYVVIGSPDGWIMEPKHVTKPWDGGQFKETILAQFEELKVIRDWQPDWIKEARKERLERERENRSQDRRD